MRWGSSLLTANHICQIVSFDSCLLILFFLVSVKNLMNWVIHSDARSRLIIYCGLVSSRFDPASIVNRYGLFLLAAQLMRFKNTTSSQQPETFSFVWYSFISAPRKARRRLHTEEGVVLSSTIWEITRVLSLKWVKKRVARIITFRQTGTRGEKEMNNEACCWSRKKKREKKKEIL